jgi:glycosyltransferase involved in cell wall biosynthesis
VVKKKVLHISQDTGGVKTYVAQVIEHADRSKYDFVILAPANTSFEAFCSENAAAYYPIDLHRGGNPFKIIAALIKIIRALRKEKPDIIHTHSAKGGFLGRLAGVLTASKNVIYTPHAFSYLSFSGIKRILFFSLEVAARRWTDTLLAISYSEAEKSVQEIGFKSEIVHVIPNAIAVDGQPQCRNRTGENLKIRMIGRLTAQKNPMLFLEVANRLLKKCPNLEFSILGAGIHDDLSEDIDCYLEKNNLKGQISIHGWGTQDKSVKFLLATDIYVMTSLFEGLPYSLLEAMSLGIPCVVSCVDGNKDVISNNENGFTCVTANDFCEKIELLVADESLRNKIGLAGYHYVKNYHNTVANIRQLEELYASLN